MQEAAAVSSSVRQPAAEPERVAPDAEVKAIAAGEATSTAAAAPPPPPEPAAAVTSSLRGSLKLVPGRGVSVAPGEVAEAFVYFMPSGKPVAPKAGRYTITTQDKRFEPGTLIVPVGSTIDFPNRDVVLHNAFSVSPDGNFDLGIYPGGDSKSHTFRQAGLVLVHCNVHHSMQADVLVVNTPFFTRVGVDGSFKLDGLPQGTGSLFLWHPRAALQSRLVDVPLASSYAAELIVTKVRVPPHMNKEGQSYRPDRAGGAR